MLLSVDAKGVSQEEERTLAALHAAARAPMFGLYDIQVGQGMVGGSLLSVETAVRESAGIAVRILQGEPAGSIRKPPVAHGRPTFDWRELQRWGISEARLPAGSLVRFRQPGVWDQYRPYIVGTSALLLLQSALIAGLMVQRARRQRMELALRDSERRARLMADQNQDLAGRLIHAQEAERTRIARDLHDDVSQQIAGVGIMLSGLKRDLKAPRPHRDVQETVSVLQERTTSLADAVRHLSHELHPGVLEHAGLVSALSQHCAEVEKIHGLAITLSAQDDLDALDFDAALCLYRVTQEALTNIVRHAGARTARVELVRAQTGVDLRISDDGIGFITRERMGSGLGLRSIDERVRLARGEVRVESRPGEGTKVVVRIPAAAAPASTTSSAAS